MRTVLLTAVLSAPALADGDPAEEISRRILQEAETHVHELQRLHATDALLEVQLRIAKKLQECRQTGYPCPGAELIPLPPGEEADRPNPVPARTLNLPQLVNIYQGRGATASRQRSARRGSCRTADWALANPFDRRRLA